MVPNYKDEWPLHMSWPFRVLFLGWWLTGPWLECGGQYLLKPSISVSPSVVVPVGGNLTIHCKSEEGYLPMEFALYKKKSSSLHHVSTKKVERDEAVFHIIRAKPSDAGMYHCIFQSAHRQWSEYSDGVHIMITGQYLFKPSISVNPSLVVPVGENVTIHCKSEERHLPAEFILCKGKLGALHHVSSQVVKRDEAVFHIIRAQPSDAGIYRCSFRPEYSPTWSTYSDKVHIKTKVLYPKPFISVDPKEVVPLGVNVSVQCNSTEYWQAEFYLLKEGSPEPTQVKMADWGAAVFSISSVKVSDGGIYWCQYRGSPTLGDRYSHASDRVYINVTDPSLAQPLIQMKPKGQHGLGAKVTIHCEGPENNLTFSLYKSMNLVASKIVNSNKNKTTFSIPTVSLEDAGSYTCRYHCKGNPYVWSEPSMPVQLVVKDDNHSLYFASMETWIRLGAGIVVFLALMLILAEAKYSWRTEQHCRNID